MRFLLPIDAAKDNAMLGPRRGAITIAPTTTAILSSDRPIVTTIVEKITISTKFRFKSTPFTTFSYSSSLVVFWSTCFWSWVFSLSLGIDASTGRTNIFALESSSKSIWRLSSTDCLESSVTTIVNTCRPSSSSDDHQ